MSDGNQSYISTMIREAMPLSEVAEALSISRPTLYKYMDYYDSGEKERLPSRIRDYFDYMSSGDVSRKDARSFLMDTVDTSGEAQVQVPEKESWSGGDLQTLCIGQDGESMVIFRDAMPAPRYTVLTVFIQVDGERVTIGRYHPEEEMKFVKVGNLIPKLDYMYVVEQGSGDLVVESEPCALRLR
ncbi:MAG: hypothetical protein J6K69_03370 [Candidatus Methanomethylophilaceae archaeon]|nr:hypothetical protein [Candidatus Methanomethylophilaceae archaeon]